MNNNMIRTINNIAKTKESERQRTINAAVKMGADEAEELINILGDDNVKDEYKRIASAMLSKLAKGNNLTTYADRIKPYLYSDTAKIRKNIAMTIGEMKGDIPVDILILALGTEEMGWVKASMLLSLGKQDGKKVNEFLSNYKSETDAETAALSKVLDKYEQVFPHNLKDKIDTPNVFNLECVKDFEYELKDELPSSMKVLSSKGGYVNVKTDDIKSLMNLRRAYSVWWMTGITNGFDTDAVLELLIKKKFQQELFNFHKEDEGVFRYRLEIINKGNKDNRKAIRAIAAAIDSKFKSIKNSAANYDIILRLKMIDGGYNVLVKLMTRSDDRFDYRIMDVPASINPVTAAIIMGCCIEYINENADVIDPFCGSGTLLVERHKLMPVKSITGIDKSSKAADAANKNINSAMIKENIIVNSDILRWKSDKLYDELFTNMPFGNRIGSHAENEILYTEFINMLPKLVKKGGLVVIYTMEKMLMGNLLKRAEIDIIDIRTLESGGLDPNLYICRM